MTLSDTLRILNGAPPAAPGSVRFLLSPGAAYRSGETIELTGGQL